MDATCPKINFERVGCFGDKHQPFARPLPDYLFNDRDPSIDNFSGRRIEWRAWDIYLPEFACRCAEAAKKANHTFFGVQFYGKCKKPCIGVLFTAVLAFSRLLANLSCIGCGQNVSKKRLWQTLNLKSYLRGQITCPSDLCVHQGLFFWPHELISASKLLTVVLTQQFSMLVLFVLNSFIVFCLCLKGECWSGLNSHMTYDIDGPRQGGCINPCYQPCAQHNKFCAGRNFENFVYRIGKNLENKKTMQFCFPSS